MALSRASLLLRNPIFQKIGFLGFIHNSPFTIHNSPFTIHNSQLASLAIPIEIKKSAQAL
jgi:hypothetical protein